MNKIQYACQCKNKDNDITYEAECDTYEEALNKVDYYRDLIRCNGEKSIHCCIEVIKFKVDDDDECIDNSEEVLKTYYV
jgi:hypothetical protein